MEGQIPRQLFPSCCFLSRQSSVIVRLCFDFITYPGFFGGKFLPGENSCVCLTVAVEIRYTYRYFFSEWDKLMYLCLFFSKTFYFRVCVNCC